MNRLEKLCRIELRNRGGKIPTLKRIKIGKVLFIYASLPIFSAWAFLIAIPLMIPISPSVWAKSKMIAFKEWRLLR